MDWHNHIEATPGVLGGKPRVKGTRIGVVFLLELLGAGWTTEQVLRNYPRVTAEDMQAVFVFAAERTGADRRLAA